MTAAQIYSYLNSQNKFKSLSPKRWETDDLLLNMTQNKPKNEDLSFESKGHSK